MSGTRILLVRAVNVGPARLPMAEFREVLAELGATDVQTYIQSGNAVARVPGAAAAFDRELEKALTARYGWTRDVMSRTPAELENALDAHPFDVVEPKYSYLSVLTAAPAKAAIAKAEELKTGEDLWSIIGKDLHIRYAHGAGRPELDVTALHRRLGVAGTARNLLTSRKLLELARTIDA